jgi:hypothetical protein
MRVMMKMEKVKHREMKHSLRVKRLKPETCNADFPGIV